MNVTLLIISLILVLYLFIWILHIFYIQDYDFNLVS